MTNKKDDSYVPIFLILNLVCVVISAILLVTGAVVAAIPFAAFALVFIILEYHLGLIRRIKKLEDSVK